jgi:hypothetical protein
MAIKPSSITKEMVIGRSSMILDSLVENNNLKLKLSIKQLSNWSAAKRKQVFRQVFLNLISGRNFWGVTQKYIRKNYNIPYWSLPLNVIQNTLVERFVNEIKEMEKASRFIPEKVITLSNINNGLLLINPDTFKYLIDNNIWVISDSLSLNSFHGHLVINEIKNLGWAYNNQLTFFKYAEDNNFNLELVSDPIKLGSILFYNELQNIKQD